MEKATIPTARSKWKCALYMAPFALISLFALFHHEPWRDEVHEFLVIVNANCLQEIYPNLRCSSPTGPLLFLITTILSFFSRAFIGLALLSWCIAFGTTALICMCSRFRPYEKILISLGYFFLYDYCIYVGRAYGLTVFIFFCILSLYQLRYQRPWLIALLAATPALASIPGLTLSVLMFGLLGWDFRKNRRSLTPLLVAAPVILAGLLFMGPVLGTQDKAFLIPQLPDATTIYYIVKGVINRIFLPVTNADMFYFPHVAVDRPHYSLLLAMVFLALTFIVAPRRLLPMVFFWTAAAVFMGLFVLRAGCGIRHHGFLMIVLLASVWLDRLYEPNKPMFTVRYLHHPTAIKLALVAILVLQVWSGLNAVYIDYKHPNSLGKEAAKFLREDMVSTPPERTLIATFNSSQAFSILVFMPQPVKFYSVELERPYRYIISNTEWYAVEPNSNRDKYNLQIIMERFIKEVQSGKYDRMYLVLPFPIDVRFNNAVLRLVYTPSTRTVMTMDELFFIYRLDKIIAPKPGDTYQK